MTAGFPRVAVTAHKRIRGVSPPSEGHTSDWREPEGPANTRNVSAAFAVRGLREAVNNVYKTDAHLVGYYLTRDGVPLQRQPRVNKNAVDWLHQQGFEIWCDTLWCDVDNPAHSPWTEKLLTEALHDHRHNPALRRCGVYFTKHGRRVFGVLDEPMPVPDVERYLEGWLSHLERAGLAVDWACRDWTRLFRLPFVRRERAAA